MTRPLNFICPTALDVLITPWDRFLFNLPSILIIGALIAVVVTVTILLIRRFYGKKKK